MSVSDPIQQIFGGGKSKKLRSEDLIRVHHDFMCVYGWVPLTEFEELPVPTIINLNVHVQEFLRKREVFMLGVLRGLGFKGNKI